MTKLNQPPADDVHEATIDWSVLDMLQTFRKQGGPDPRTRLTNIFLNSSPAILDAMRIALQSSDAVSLANAAHSMKSGSLNMGATGLGDLCATLEKIVRSGTTEKAGNLLSRIELEYAAVEAAFKKLVSENED